MRQPDYAVAASFGVNYADISMKLSGAATVNGKPVSFASKEASAPAPLPLIGLRGGWVVTSVLGFRARLQTASAGTPFYELPTLDMRGFSRDRYRDNYTLSVTAEWRHKFTPRWGMVAFAEAGRYAISTDDRAVFIQIGEKF